MVGQLLPQTPQPPERSTSEIIGRILAHPIEGDVEAIDVFDLPPPLVQTAPSPAPEAGDEEEE